LFKVNSRKPCCPHGGKLADRVASGICLYKEGRDHVVTMGEADGTMNSAVCTLQTSSSARLDRTSQVTT
jgi:hypothetical protein